MPLASFLFSSSYCLPTGFNLSQRGEVIIVSGNVGIKDVAVDFRGFQRGVTQQLLERKGVSAAVLLAPGENRHFEPGENSQFQPDENRQSIPEWCSQLRLGCRF